MLIFRKTLVTKKWREKIISRTCARGDSSTAELSLQSTPQVSRGWRLVLEKSHSTCLHKFTGASEHVSVITCVEGSICRSAAAVFSVLAR